MKLIYKIIIVLISFTLFTGCPLETPFPLGEANIPVDSTLLGKWLGVDPKNLLDTICFKLMKFNKNEYFMEFYGNGGLNSKSHDNLRCYETKISGVRIMNITEISRQLKFSYYRLIVNGKQMKISYISDEFIKERFDKQDQLINVLNKNIGNEKLFDGNIVLKKVENQ